MINHIQEILKSNIIQEYKTIPIDWDVPIFRAIEFKGWGEVTLSEDDETFNDMLTIASQTIAIFINHYQKKYAFTEPQFIWRDYEIAFAVKIGMMELEEYERRIEKEKP